MSVEEARGQAHGAINDLAYRNAEPWLAERAHDAIERLILEVQAEMPCYEWVRWEAATLKCGGYPIPKEEPLFCPSCTAKQKLGRPYRHEA